MLIQIYVAILINWPKIELAMPLSYEIGPYIRAK